MAKIRLVFLIILVLVGFGLAGLFYFQQPQTRPDSSPEPFYRLFGHANKGAHQALTPGVFADSPPAAVLVYEMGPSELSQCLGLFAIGVEKNRRGIPGKIG